MDHRLLAVAAHHHLLLLQLLGDVLGTAARHLDPGLAEEGAAAEHEDDVEHGVDRVLHQMAERLRRREVVAEAADGVGPGGARRVGPDAQEVHQEVAAKLDRHHLRDDVEVGDESGLEDDGNVAGVEELDRVGAVLAAVARRLDRQIDAEALEVDDDGEDENGREEVHQVGQVAAVEGLAQAADLVLAGGQQVEEGDDGALKLRSATGVDGGRAEGLPHYSLADVRGDEEGDTGAKAVALLQQLVEEEDDEAGDEELDDDQQADAGANVARVAVHAGHDVDNCLADGDHHAEELLRAVEQRPVLGRIADFDDLRAGEQLHNQTGGDDRGDTEFHQRATIGGENDAHPVEGIGRVGGHDAEEGNLAANEEDEEGDRRPEDLLAELDLPLRLGHLGEDAAEGLDHFEELDAHGDRWWWFGKIWSLVVFARSTSRF